VGEGEEVQKSSASSNYTIINERPRQKQGHCSRVYPNGEPHEVNTIRKTAKKKNGDSRGRVHALITPIVGAR